MTPHAVAQALAALGRAGLGLPCPPDAHEVLRIGEYTLLPHQTEAVERLRPLLATHGGAVLADAVGLGKTIVALALAHEYQSARVIAPAALVPMWRDTARRAAVNVHVQSLHRFPVASEPGSSALPPDSSASATVAASLVIIDEAHHLRNPNTNRYAGVAAVCRNAHVLLLSATPIHNKSSDLAHMLALFLGESALSLPLQQLHNYVIRRDEQTSIAKPHVVAHPQFHIGDNAEVTRALAGLPPPVPTRDGAVAGALVTLGLVRAWCSSASACLSAVQRRRARALALDSILSEGRWPSQTELRAWTVTEDTVQLGFTALLVSNGDGQSRQTSLADAHAQLTRHREALESLEAMLRGTIASLDRARGEALRRVRRAHAGVTIIAFSQYADTVRALGRVLRWDVGVATLTSRGGQIASGPLSRRELLRRVAPRAHGVSAPPTHERVYLLLTTDLLAEGVNLQDAGVVVHLDWPWTPAAIAQREGRIARLGSTFREVHAYAIAPPGGGTALLRLAERLRVKARTASVVLASDATPKATRRLMALPSASSPLERTLRRWTELRTSAIADRRSADGRSECRGSEIDSRANGALPFTDVVVVNQPRSGWLAARQSELVGGWFTGSRTRVSRVRKTLSVLVQAVDRVTQQVSSGDDPRIATHIAAVHRALQRDAQREQRRTLVSTLQSPVHRAQRMIRNLLAGAPLHERLRLRPLAAAASCSVRALRGAGDERALESLLQTPPSNAQAEQWLRSVTQLRDDAAVSPSDNNTVRTAPDASPLVIVLLLPTATRAQSHPASVEPTPAHSEDIPEAPQQT